MQQFEKRSSGAVVAYPGPASRNRSFRQERAVSGRPQRHGEDGAAAIVMPDGFPYLTGAALLGAAGGSGAPRHWLDPHGWWLSVGAAMSWLSVQIVEGFALSAAVTHAEFIWPLGDENPAGELPGGPIRESWTGASRSAAQAEHEEHDEHEVVRYRPLHAVRQIQPAVGGAAAARRDVDADLSSSNLSHESDPSWSEWTISILAALRSRVVRRRAATRMKTEWQAIDERTLRDIGLSRYDVGLIVGDGHRWG
jgi:uncharacterized protein YjiS (DUF1127 family)